MVAAEIKNFGGAIILNISNEFINYQGKIKADKKLCNIFLSGKKNGNDTKTLFFEMKAIELSCAVWYKNSVILHCDIDIAVHQISKEGNL